MVLILFQAAGLIFVDGTDREPVAAVELKLVGVVVGKYVLAPRAVRTGRIEGRRPVETLGGVIPGPSFGEIRVFPVATTGEEDVVAVGTFYQESFYTVLRSPSRRIRQ